jgi:hypothetical protein
MTDEASVEGRSLRQAAILTAAVGIAFSVLFGAAFLLLTGVPGPEAGDAAITAYYTAGEQTTVTVVGLYIMPFAGMAFLWFIVALRMWAAASVRSQSVLQSNLQLVSGIIFVALFFTGAAASAVTAVSAQLSDSPVDPAAARQILVYGQTLITFFAMRMAAMFVLTTSGIGRSAGILPRWFSLVGFAVGLVLLLQASFEPVVVLVFPAWVLALSIILLRVARAIPRETRMPARVGVGMLNPLGTYGEKDQP